MPQPRALAVEWAVIKIPTAVIALHLLALVGWATMWVIRG